MPDITYPAFPEVLLRPPQHPPLALDPLRPPDIADGAEVTVTLEYPLTLDPHYLQFVRIIAASLATAADI